jgi:hypothetical protein
MKVAIHDWNRECPVIQIKNKDHAKELNKDGYAIYQTVNTFEEYRRETHLKKLNYFYVEFDDCNKLDQAMRLKPFLEPTKIIESKAGYHVYWEIEDDLVKNEGKDRAIIIYKAILNQMVYHFNSDDAVKDVTRILRVPGYYHQKNPEDPFMIKKVYQSKAKYLSHQFLTCLKPLPIKKKKKPTAKDDNASTEFWDKAHKFDVYEGLRRISGAPELGGEVIEVKNNQIWVNNKPTANWIDDDGFIGSHGGGGPNLSTWIKWYTGSWGETYKILVKYIPELNVDT